MSTRGGQETIFDDELLQQVLEVGPIVARSLPMDMMLWQITNVHGAANTQTTALNPYSANIVSNTQAFSDRFQPRNVPLDAELEWWLLAVCGFTTGQDCDAIFQFIPPSAVWDSADDPIGGPSGFILAQWDSRYTGVTGHNFLQNSITGQTVIPLNLRLPRGFADPDGTEIGFISTSAGATDCVLQVLVAQVPIGSRPLVRL